MVIMGIGVLGLLWGVLHGEKSFLYKAACANQGLLAMLAAVSFLRLITQPRTPKDDVLPQGRNALWQTMLGLHLFGALTNLSALIIIGDRLASTRKLNRLQAMVLSRAFAAAAFWSPFFAAMAVALTYAPGARLPILVIVGLPLALAALILSGLEFSGHRDINDFIGYPMHFGALWIPSLLAVAVLLLHEWLPHLSILTVISLSSLLLSGLILLCRQGFQAPKKLCEHILSSLPNMSGELVLFLAAGVMSAGIASVFKVSMFNLPFHHFGVHQASILLLIMVGLAVLSVHPVISITTIGGLLAPLVPDPNLLGITFLITWGLGVAISPLSGLHLAIQGRYGVSSHAFIRWNGLYVLKMFLLAVAALHIYAALE
jgi:hypothetical protein